MRGIEPAVFPPVDAPGERAGGPLLVVDIGRLQDLLDEADLIVGVEDGEIGLEIDKFGVDAQYLGADRVKRAHPRHALDEAGEAPDPLAHFARRLVGEGHREDFVRPGAPRGDEMGDAGGQHARLADASARQHQHRPVQRLDRLALRRVERFKVARRAARAGALRNAQGFGRAVKFMLGVRLVLAGQSWGLSTASESCAANVGGATPIVEETAPGARGGG